jgi:hypothetical protein
MHDRSTRSSTLLHALAPLLLFAGCAPNGYGVARVTFNLCEPLVVTPDADATPDQLDGISQAEALWNTIAGARLALPAAAVAAAGASMLPLHFQAAAGNFHGLYDDQSVQVFINSDLAGHDRVVTIAHELGHTFGLSHVPPDQRPSVMNPGNLTVEPTSQDAAKVEAIWGSCSSQ